MLDSLKTVAPLAGDHLYKFRKMLLGILMAGLGVGLGTLMNTSRPTIELTISIAVILLTMLIILQRPLNGLLFLLVFLQFIDTSINIPLGDGLPDLSFSRFIVAFLAIFMLARASIGKYKLVNTPIGLMEILGLAMLGGLALAAPLSVNPIGTLQAMITDFLVPFALYFFAKHLIRSHAELNELLTAVVILGFLVALYGTYEHFTGNILFVRAGKEASELNTIYTGTESLKLLRGLLGRGSHFGRVLISTIPVTFYLFFESKSVSRKSLLLSALALQFYCLFITYNRTAWYSLPISMTIIQFFYPQFRRAYFVLLLATAMVFFAFSDQINRSEVVQERVNHKTEDYNGRTTMWETAFTMWKEKPIRGWGFGQYQKESGRFRTDGVHRNLKAIENDFLYLMVGSGLLGFLPYAGFMLVALVNSIFLFLKARASDWQGFIKPETITIYWCVMIAFLIGSYTQVQVFSIIRIIPFTLTGAIVGAHQYWLKNGRKPRKGTAGDEAN